MLTNAVNSRAALKTKVLAARPNALAARRSPSRTSAATPAPTSRPTLSRRTNVGGSSVATRSMINELALLAETTESQAAEIFKTAGVMFVITLAGLALGFVLLRVESLVEAGNKD